MLVRQDHGDAFCPVWRAGSTGGWWLPHCVLLCDAPVRAVQAPEMRGHRYVEKKEFRCDDIAARLNSIIKAVTPDELAMLGLPADYEAEFLRRKKHLFDVNRNFEWTWTTRFALYAQAMPVGHHSQNVWRRNSWQMPEWLASKYSHWAHWTVGENPRDAAMVDVARELGYDLSGTTTVMTRERLTQSLCLTCDTVMP